MCEFELFVISMYQPPSFQAADFLILWHTVPKYLIISYGILIDSAAIAGVAFNGVNNTVLDFSTIPT